MFKFLKRKKNIPIVSFDGNYDSWVDACKHSDGYSQKNILQKTHQTCLLLRDNKIKGERDSVAFDTPQISFHLLSALYYAYSIVGKLNIIDFGGSLGSTYLQHRKLFPISCIEKWVIVEQESYVDLGQKNYADDVLCFESKIPKLIERKNNFFIFSSVLQYVENPYKLIREITDLNSQYMFIEKTFFSSDDNNYLTIQNVREPIYKASYPAWHLSKAMILSEITNFKNVFEFDNDTSIIYDFGQGTSTCKGFFLKNDT